MIYGLGILGIIYGLFFMSKSEASENVKEVDKYDYLFKKYADGYPWQWLKAIAKQESDLGRDPRTSKGQVSYDGLSWGLMQIAEGKGSKKEIEIKGFGGPEKLNDAEYSVKTASKLVKYLYNKYGDKDKVFLAYNQGEQNTDMGKDYTVQYPQKINKWLDQIYKGTLK